MQNFFKKTGSAEVGSRSRLKKFFKYAKGDRLQLVAGEIKNSRKKVLQSRKRGSLIVPKKVERGPSALEWFCILC